jgi:hypothetical protein
MFNVDQDKMKVFGNQEESFLSQLGILGFGSPKES